MGPRTSTRQNDSHRLYGPKRQIISTLKLKQTNINYSKTHKFLGITFDENITFGQHIDKTLTKASKTINILKTTKGKDWGTDTFILLTCTKTLIYSVIDYGSTTYTATNNSKIKQLQIIQNKALRICTNALPNTKNEELYNKTGHLTLIERRDKQTLKQWANRIQHGSNLPTNTHLQNKKWDKKGYNLQKAKKKKSNKWTENKLPPYQLTKKLLEKHNLNSLNTEDHNTKPQPPWTINPPIIDLTLLKQPKKYSNPPLAKQKALEHINKKYPNHYYIYTD